MKLLDRIKQGKSGRNIGISTGKEKLDKTIFGVQKGFGYTVGASSGVGKSSFAIDTFIYNVFKNKGDRPTNFIIYSFELSREVLCAKLLSRYIFDSYNKVINYSTILSFTDPISDEDYDVVIKAYKEFIPLFLKSAKIYDVPMSPDSIDWHTREWLKQFGEFVEPGGGEEVFIENDINHQYIMLTDHIGLLGGNGTTKEKIDNLAKKQITLRNIAKLTWINVQQLNRGVSSVERKTQGFELIGLEDFKDSSGSTDASEVVIALYSPYREKVARCEGYPISNVLKEKFILIEVIKSRFGKMGVNIGSILHGDVVMFTELPRPDEIGDYSKYLDLNNLNKKEDKIENTQEKDNFNEHVFKF